MKLEEIGIECDISPTYKTGEQNMIEYVFYKALDIYLGLFSSIKIWFDDGLGIYSNRIVMPTII